MAISSDLIKDFVKVTNDNKPTASESTLYGKIVIYNDREYVQLDGSDVLTPVSSTASVSAGERVMVQIKNHTATVTGNMSSPSASSGTVKKLAENITEFEVVVAERIEANDAEIEKLIAEDAKINGLLDADKAEIDELKAKNVTIEGTLMAVDADIDDLKANKLDVSVAHAEFATINELEAVDADIHNLEATYGEFTELTTKGFEAVNAEIKNLDTKYAEIDFSNIEQAAVEKLFTESGIIEDLVVKEGKITGELVGVTIKGDLIEGNTLKADKLVVKGSDGLYYKLNIEGGATTSEQVSEEDLQNGLSGSIIVAKSITASKIAVDDLVAFDATIGGFNITDDAIYSGVKGTVESPSRGIYLDNTGQVAFGDDKNYLRYFKDGDVWKLEITAQTITFGATGKSVEEVVKDMQTEMETMKDEITVDVKAYYRYYLLQSSTLSTPSKPTTYPPASTWDDTEPSYVDGSTNTLYFVDCTIFNDNTFTYSEVSKSSSYEAAKSAYNKAVNTQTNLDNLEIGGRNLIRNSETLIFENYAFEYLPNDYIEADYIEVTGTQYIDTGFKPNQDTRIVCEFKYTGGNGVYGARSTVSSRNFSMRVINGAWQMGYGEGVLTGTIPSDTTNWHIADHNKNELYIDGELAATREYVEFSAPYPVAIGAIRAGSMYYGQGRYRRCKIYDNGILVRELIPCLNPDGEAGMYDLVTEAFFGNAGSDMIGYALLS